MSPSHRTSALAVGAYLLVSIAWIPLVGSLLRWLNCGVPALPGDWSPLASMLLTAVSIAVWFWVRHRSVLERRSAPNKPAAIVLGTLAIALAPIALFLASPLTPDMAQARQACGVGDWSVLRGLVLYLPLTSFALARLLNPTGHKLSLSRIALTFFPIVAGWAAYAVIVRPFPFSGA